jgi:hypothetical protein
MNVTSIHALNPVLDNPLFEGFAVMDNSPSLLGRESIFEDFFPSRREDWNWRIEPIKHLWKPLKVEGRVGSYNDFPCLNLMVPAFSERAVRVLSDMLKPNGELLPLIHPAGRYYAYNCTTIVEILDQEQTKGSWLETSRQAGAGSPACAGGIEEFAVFPDRIQDLTIFRMRELCNWVFVTNVFVERALQAGLNGFCFDKAWPWPKGTDWAWESRKLSKQMFEVVSTPDGDRAIKGESIIIRFELEDKKISSDEKKRIARYADEINAQLIVSSLDAPYFGSLEGRKTSGGRTSLILSCPDRHRLFEKLRPWLSQLAWPTKPEVLLRHLPFDDTTKCGEPVEF